MRLTAPWDEARFDILSRSDDNGDESSRAGYTLPGRLVNTLSPDRVCGYLGAI